VDLDLSGEALGGESPELADGPQLRAVHVVPGIVLEQILDRADAQLGERFSPLSGCSQRLLPRMRGE
jgi:hypothetical protein